MQTFKQYFLCEVKASKSNIDLFKKKYQLGEYGSESVRGIHSAHPQNAINLDSDIAKLIDEFTKEVKRGTIKQKDIFGFESHGALLDALEAAKKMKSGSELKRLEKGGATRVFENDKALVIHPKTHEASCHYGAGAKWCTAARDPRDFKNYTDDQGVVLLYFLPKGESFEIAHGFKVKETSVNDANVDHLIMHYPDAFIDWSYDSSTKAIGQYIKAAYLNNRPSEPLSTIVGWAEENKIAVAQTRTFMERVIQNWNLNGSEIMMKVLGDGWDPAAEEMQDQADYLMHMAQQEGLTGFLTTAWGDITPGDPGAEEPIEDNWTNVKKVMSFLHQGAQGIGRDHPVKEDTRKNAKLAIAVYALGDESEEWLDDEERQGEMEEVTGKDHSFGKYTAEAYNAEDANINVSEVIRAAGLSSADIKKISEYVGQHAEDKIWEDKDPNKVFTFMERKSNQTPANFKKADAFYLNEPNAAFSASAWNYAQDLRTKKPGPMDDYVAELGPNVKKAAWKELEDIFIQQLDSLVGEETRVKDLMIKKKTFDGVQEIRADLEKEHGSSVGAPEPTTWVKEQFDKWRKQSQRANSFLSSAMGLLGYLFKVKKYNWPELEKRILDPKYYAVGTLQLGPSWIQHGMNGDRWEEYEEVLFKVWKSTTDNPYRNQKHIDAASTLDNNLNKSGFGQSGGSGVTPWERDSAKLNIADHINLHGSVEDVIQLVKYTKRALGGGTGGSEEAAWNEAKDAWWNRPEIVALYWGNGGIVKKQKPSEKKRGKDASKWFVTDDRIQRPFYHEVKPGAWLPGIPDIFTISNSHVDKQYVGQFNPGEPPSMSIGNLVDRHDGRRRGLD